MDPITVSLILAGIGAIAEAVPKFIPDKDRRERIDELEDKVDTGLTKEEEAEMAALMASSDASQNKAILAAIQETNSGAGQISGGDLITSQKVAQEQASKASQRRGMVISARDREVKEGFARELAALEFQESQWRETRNQAVGGLIKDTADMGSQYYTATQTPNVYNDADLAASRQSSIQAESPFPDVPTKGVQAGTSGLKAELAALGYSGTALDLFQNYTLSMTPQDAYDLMVSKGVR
tara:strand:- start:1835 stop:2551 length:717 start_codon:yes stop_codon:yes gene_type:complete